jgi:predicted O-linked N-acetylglucosamine transferase (SPINDLY family)
MLSAKLAGELIVQGNRLEASGRLAEACALYQRAIEADPAHPAGYLNLGGALEARGDPQGAGAAYRALLERDAANPFANYNLAMLALARGAAGAVPLLERALAAKPDFPEAHVALAHALESAGELEQAAHHLRRALELRPGFAGAWYNYALLQRRLDNPDAEEDALTRALAIEPDNAAALQVLAPLLRGAGRVAEALELYARARRLDPQSFRLESAELFALLFSDAVSEQELFARHRAFGERLEGKFSAIHQSSLNNQRLRIGYLSPDLWRHPVALFLIPVLARHDRSAFEIFCYSTGTTSDSVTEELRGLADTWRDAAAMSDEALADAVRKDGIDILVDLAGHSGDARLAVFARRPAPVQVSWLGYLHTTGLRSIQYRLCDRHTDPQPQADALHTEKLVRLPHSQWCYRPFLEVAHAPEPPSRGNGFVTFGSFNQPAKISPLTLRRWRELLERVPGSRLLVAGVTGGRTARALRQELGEARVRIAGRVGLDEFFRLLDTVDIALDAAPYSGGTTTCDALWMGVPVVTEPGARSVSRSAASVLATLGLADWIAAPGEYAALAAAKARDAAGLAALRGTLRSRMRSSPLMDEAGFTRALEAAYRSMRP